MHAHFRVFRSNTRHDHDHVPTCTCISKSIRSEHNMMAAPLLPSLFPRPPLPPHHQFHLPPPAPGVSVTSWGLPPPPVQFYQANIPPYGVRVDVGPCNYPRPPGQGFRGRGVPHRGFRGRGCGGIRRGGRGAQAGEKRTTRPAGFSCKVCNKEYRCEESYQIHLQSHQKVPLLNTTCTYIFGQPGEISMFLVI